MGRIMFNTIVCSYHVSRTIYIIKIMISDGILQLEIKNYDFR